MFLQRILLLQQVGNMSISDMSMCVWVMVVSRNWLWERKPDNLFNHYYNHCGGRVSIVLCDISINELMAGGLYMQDSPSLFGLWCRVLVDAKCVGVNDCIHEDGIHTHQIINNSRWRTHHTPSAMIK